MHITIIITKPVIVIAFTLLIRHLVSMIEGGVVVEALVVARSGHEWTGSSNGLILNAP